jgi:DNA recombination protein RmuC
METALIILVIVAIAGNIVLVATLLRRKNEKPAAGQGLDEGLKLVLEQMNTNVNQLSSTLDRKVGDLAKTVDSKMAENSRSVQDSLKIQFADSSRQITESSKLIKEVTVGLTKLDATNKQVVSFADQLQGLQDILKNPKQRGILGEYYLETLLKNVLAPGQYQMQYAFKNGEIVDAAVFVKDKIIPVDSKFSLENYNRMVEEKNPAEKEKLEKSFVGDLKMRIQETAKYVRPAEKTMDFAFMFIPHEAIYYDLLVNKIGAGSSGMGGVGGVGEGDADNLIQRAASKYKVIIVSPTSFLAYLQTVLQGLKAMQIEETAKDIVKHVGQLGVHIKRYEEYHQKLGASLDTVVNHYNNSGKEFLKIDKDVLRITDESPGIKVVAIEGPEEQ